MASLYLVIQVRGRHPASTSGCGLPSPDIFGILESQEFNAENFSLTALTTLSKKHACLWPRPVTSIAINPGRRNAKSRSVLSMVPCSGARVIPDSLFVLPNDTCPGAAGKSVSTGVETQASSRLTKKTFCKTDRQNWGSLAHYPDTDHACQAR